MDVIELQSAELAAMAKLGERLCVKAGVIVIVIVIIIVGGPREEWRLEEGICGGNQRRGGGPRLAVERRWSG